MFGLGSGQDDIVVDTELESGGQVKTKYRDMRTDGFIHSFIRSCIHSMKNVPGTELGAGDPIKETIRMAVSVRSC